MTIQVTSQWRSLSNAVDHTPWQRNTGLKWLLFYTSILYMGEFLIGYDGTIVGSLQALDKWKEDLGNPDASKIGLLNAVPYFSGIVMGPINSIVVDRFGRRWPLRFYGVTMIIGTILGCVAGIKPSAGYGLFVASKLIIGFGITAFMMTAQIMLQEIGHPRYRAATAALWDGNFTLGSTLASLVTFGCSYISTSWCWRIPYLLQLIPATYIVIAIQFTPETPRFLMANGREEEAREFLVKYHGNGDENDPLVNFEFEEMKETLASEQEAMRTPWKDILKAPGNKHRMGLVALMTFMPQLNGSTIISYYYTVVLKLGGIEGASKLTGMGVGLNVLGYLSLVAGVISLKYFRRRTMVLVTWPILMVGLAATAIATQRFLASGQTNKAAGNAAVALVWLYNIPSCYISPLFYSYPAEVLNYSTRGKGMAVWNTVNQGWGAYGSYVNSIALANITWKYYLVLVPILAVQMVLAYFFMVETRGLTLEEVAIAFEGESSAVAQAVVHAGEVAIEGNKGVVDEKADEAAVTTMTV